MDICGTMDANYQVLLQAAKDVVDARTSDGEREAITKLSAVITEVTKPIESISLRDWFLQTGPCACCGKPDSPRDLGSGGPFRCSDVNCVVF